MKRTWLYLIIITVALLFSSAYFFNQERQEDIQELPDTISYNFHVRPILSDKCFSCHGPDEKKRAAGLRLDIAEAAYEALKETPSAHGIVPGQPEVSEVFKRISTMDTSIIMPPVSTNMKLRDTEIALIKEWIKQGARYEKHWSFVKVSKPELPEVEDKEWARNEIDFFVLKNLKDKGLTPNMDADKERLLRRLSLDITGLPPSLALQEQFKNDESSNAYEKITDKLLASKAYGEKMAVLWMDIARYADSHGYQDDNYRSHWPWRDWVIHAFDKNMPYNDFVTWQLAGDLMPNATKEHLLATAFNRNHKITEEAGVINEEYRVEYVADRVNTVSKGLLGVTLECARCHDHKYDPLSQKEHFQMFAFFNNVSEKGLESAVGGPETFAKKPLMTISDKDVKSILKFINKIDTTTLIVSVMEERDTLRKTYILDRGVYDQPTEEVQPGTPKAILPFSDKLPKNRLGLSKWMFDKNNPLTARVFVNQMWQELFGRGIVKTAGDFGMQGELPSNPQLLDWLAADLMDHGWDIKYLIKKIVSSSTYRQAAEVSPKKLKKDPENIYLSRYPRHRIKAEFVRDVILTSSGLLNAAIGGPSLKPYQPAGLWESATSGRGLLTVYKQDRGDKLYRRGLYTFIKRTVPFPSMTIFDASNRDQCEVVRLRTNTPLQALVMLNDPTVWEASRVMAQKLMLEKSSEEQKVIKAFRMIVSRYPKEKEIEIIKTYLNGQRKAISVADARKLLSLGEYSLNRSLNVRELAALTKTLAMIYNLEETITKS